MAGRKWQPKVGASPTTRQIRIGGNPDETDKSHPAWQFHRLDVPHAHWGWTKVDRAAWIQILQQLQGLETMTWADIKSAAGGRRRGTNNHSLDIADFCKAARDRWTELRLDEFDSVFSLRLQGKLRLYGIRDGRALRIVWYDPHHGSESAAYPTGD